MEPVVVGDVHRHDLGSLIELTVDPNDDRIGLSPSERRRIAVLCRLQPPQRRYGALREIEFGLRELERSP